MVGLALEAACRRASPESGSVARSRWPSAVRRRSRCSVGRLGIAMTCVVSRLARESVDPADAREDGVPPDRGVSFRDRLGQEGFRLRHPTEPRIGRRPLVVGHRPGERRDGVEGGLVLPRGQQRAAVLERRGGPDHRVRAVEQRDERAIRADEVARLEAALSEERRRLLRHLRTVPRERGHLERGNGLSAVAAGDHRLPADELGVVHILAGRVADDDRVGPDLGLRPVGLRLEGAAGPLRLLGLLGEVVRVVHPVVVRAAGEAEQQDEPEEAPHWPRLAVSGPTPLLRSNSSR